ncbi:hypothetical protein [Millisia brevis]|uniref:hypothetical protein n=1 Tax=Millisia brevis TaxID=264148 RepID=UPI0012ED012A|nr:hypothetical protein [Millisia brevis]
MPDRVKITALAGFVAMAFWQFFAVAADVGKQRILMWALLLFVISAGITWLVTGRRQRSDTP